MPLVKNIGNMFKLAFSTLDDGNMVRTQTNRQEVHENRQRFFRSVLPEDTSLLRIRPSHSSNIDIIRRESNKIISFERHFTSPTIITDFDYYNDGSDGFVARDSKVALALISGDCVPVFFWNEATAVFGLLHVGMLGTLNNMVSALPRVLEPFGLDAGAMNYFFGPSISQPEYDVSKSGLWNAIYNQIETSSTLSAKVKPFLSNEMFFDMKGMIETQLIALGAEKENIENYPISTASPGSIFFSHYTAIQAGKTPGGFCSLICNLHP